MQPRRVRVRRRYRFGLGSYAIDYYRAIILRRLKSFKPLHLLGDRGFRNILMLGDLAVKECLEGYCISRFRKFKVIARALGELPDNCESGRLERDLAELRDERLLLFKRQILIPRSAAIAAVNSSFTGEIIAFYLLG